LNIEQPVLLVFDFIKSISLVVELALREPTHQSTDNTAYDGEGQTSSTAVLTVFMWKMGAVSGGSR
jgi:hypothetical protein